MSSRANQFIAETPEPPAWLTRVCQSPMGKSLFLYILKDPVLHDHLRTGDYNALIDFFTSTLLLNSSDLCSSINQVDLNCCSYATTVLFFDRILQDLAQSATEEECEQKVSRFLQSYSFSSVQECNVFINYIASLLTALPNPHIQMLLQQLLERVFDKLRAAHSITPVSTRSSSRVDHSALLRRHRSLQRSLPGHPRRSHRRLQAARRAELATPPTLSRRSSSLPAQSTLPAAVLLSRIAAGQHSVLRKSLHGERRADSALASCRRARGEGAGAAAANAPHVHIAGRGAISRPRAARMDAESVRRGERIGDGDRVVLSRVLHAVAGNGGSDNCC